MGEAQQILLWIKSTGVSDREVAHYFGVTRETIVRIRNAKNRCDGSTILADLRTLAVEYSMPGYTASQLLVPTPSPGPRASTPKIVATPSTKSQPSPRQTASHPAYKVGTIFNCHKCNFRNKARAANSYCVNGKCPTK